MIKKVQGGFKVYSESGKPLSSTYPTRKGAEQRLSQIEYHKNKKK